MDPGLLLARHHAEDQGPAIRTVEAVRYNNHVLICGDMCAASPRCGVRRLIELVRAATATFHADYSRSSNRRHRADHLYNIVSGTGPPLGCAVVVVLFHVLTFAA